jgi:hypothetical protein
MTLRERDLTEVVIPRRFSRYLRLGKAFPGDFQGIYHLGKHWLVVFKVFTAVEGIVFLVIVKVDTRK